LELLVAPWTGPYYPLWVSVGWLAMIFLILTGASGGLRRLLPGWRVVHLLAYLTFVLSLLHGLFSASDSGSYLTLAVYLVSLLAVVVALVLRFYPGLLQARRRTAAVRPEYESRAARRSAPPQPRTRGHLMPSFTERVKAKDYGIDAEWDVEHVGDGHDHRLLGSGWNVYQYKMRDLSNHDRLMEREELREKLDALSR